MKNMIKLPAILLGLLLMLTGGTQKAMAQGDDVSLQSFYDELSPYGTWIQDPQYGYVWRPDVEQSDFRPYYTNGRWVMTEYGNTWVSNYDWGWAPFHYGRWVYNRYNQWVWIPDTTWGPAWVSWRTGGGYYGWAPMGPGMSININFNIPDLWWVFIPQRNIYYDRFPRYYSRRNVTIINRTTIINNTYVNNRRTYYTGPRADDIRRATRQDVRVYNVNNTTRPSRSNINGNNLNIYTPRPGRGNANTDARPREAIRGEGYTTARPDRNSNTNGTPTTRPSRGDNQGNNNRGNVPPTRNDRTGATNSPDRRPEMNNSSRPSRTQTRENNGNQPQRTERVAPTRETPAQRPQQQTAPQQQPERRERVERTQPTARPERAERPVQRETPAPQQRPVQQQPQRQERQAPPQRQQMQRPERAPQSVQPSRSNENRGNQGGGRSEGSRPGRGQRG